MKMLLNIFLLMVMSIFNSSCFESRAKVTKEAIELKIKENERFDSLGFAKWLNSLSIEEKFLFLEVFLPGKVVTDPPNNVWIFSENGKIYAKEITIKNANIRTLGKWNIKNSQLIIDNWSEEFPGRNNIYRNFGANEYKHLDKLFPANSGLFIALYKNEIISGEPDFDLLIYWKDQNDRQYNELKEYAKENFNAR
ncbi:hypothetical protein [Leptospira soteropolitanensis]|nr:hypothetical protein [Leptospira soteropolitanensis]MCW7492551.1 hypothetical protein [Leptospira soteropolitanensis]